MTNATTTPTAPTQPEYTDDCANCGTADHAGTVCPCACHPATTQTYAVQPERLATLTAKLDTLNRRAVKLGVALVTYTVGDLQTAVEYFDRCGQQLTDGTSPRVDHTEVRAWHDVTLTTAPVKLAGWTFIATLDHASEAGVVLRTVPGETVPVSYREASNACDHCQTKRNRAETFVVRHDDGTHKQIGRQCVRDFLGVDPTQAARLAELSIAIGEALDGERDFVGGGSRDYLALGTFMSAVAVAIRLWGWRSRKVAQQIEKTATVDDAFCLIYPGRPDPRSDDERERQRPTEADRAQADAAIAWARALRTNGEELSDYLWNVTVVASGEVLARKSAGIAASIISAYQRAIGQELERRTAAAVSQYVGTVGTRQDFAALTVVFLRSIDGNYGPTTICTFLDPAGNRIKWFASGEPDFEQGDTVTLKATVKAHSDAYQGIKETTITRAKVTARVAAAAAA